MVGFQDCTLQGLQFSMVFSACAGLEQLVGLGVVLFAAEEVFVGERACPRAILLSCIHWCTSARSVHGCLYLPASF